MDARTYSNIQAERELIFRLADSKTFRDTYFAEIKPENFFDLTCREFFERIQKAGTDNFHISNILNNEKLEEAMFWADCGASEMGGVDDSYLLETIKHANAVRTAAGICHEALLNPKEKDCIGKMIDQLLEINIRRGDYQEFTMQQLTERALKKWETGESVRKIYKLGLPVIDDLVKIKQGNMVYIVAPPKVGKTWMEATIAANVSEDAKTVFISAEMHPEDLYTRLASKIVKEDMTNLDFEYQADRTRLSKFMDNIDLLLKKNLTIMNARGIEFGELMSKCRAAANAKAKIIIIDYLQRIQHPNQDIRLATMDMSRKLTNFAAKNDILMIVATQAGRAAKSAQFTQAHHAKESGAIEEDADLVLSLTNSTDFENWQRGEFYSMIIDIFQRNGYCGKVKMLFDPTRGEYLPDSWENKK